MNALARLWQPVLHDFVQVWFNQRVNLTVKRYAFAVKLPLSMAPLSRSHRVEENEMNLPRERILFIAAMLGAFTSTTISFWLMYQSGCAGDLKTGSYGDPIKALRIESIAMQVLFVAMILYAMAYYFKSKRSVLFRAVGALAIMVFVFVISFVPGVYFQSLGVTSCH